MFEAEVFSTEKRYLAFERDQTIHRRLLAVYLVVYKLENYFLFRKKITKNRYNFFLYNLHCKLRHFT